MFFFPKRWFLGEGLTNCVVDMGEEEGEDVASDDPMLVAVVMDAIGLMGEKASALNAAAASLS